LRTAAVTIAIGLIPALIAEFLRTPFPSVVWGLLILAGIFQTFYFLGITLGYRIGHFTVVYPVARSLPVVILALIDVARGHPPAPLGWLGILLVTTGCMLAPLESIRTFHWRYYFNRAGLFILMIAFAIVGYTIVDKIALEQLPIGIESAVRYGVWEVVFTAPFLFIGMRLIDGPVKLGRDVVIWRRAGVVALSIAAAYWLILWAYQLVAHASYVVAMRQLSIVLGVLGGAILLKEPAAGLRIFAALLIVAGVACIALA
jgi:drug/metabolite transporter (DMT)-like permease